MTLALSARRLLLAPAKAPPPNAPVGFRAIAIGAPGAFFVLRLGSATQWQTPVIPQG